MIACSPPLADCNAIAEDGCETDTSSSPQHCGACGHDCIGGDCVDAACQPFVLADASTIAGVTSPIGNGFLALDLQYVYFSFTGTSSGGIARVKKDGTGAACVACGVGQPREIGLDSQSVYWTDTAPMRIQQAALAGSPPVLFLSGSAGSPIAVGGSAVYWHDTMSLQMRRSAVPDAATTTLLASQPGVSSIHYAEGLLFWGSATEIIAADVTVTPPTPLPLLSSLAKPRSLATDNLDLYWIQGTAGSESVCHTDKAAVAAVNCLIQANTFAIAVDGEHVYGTNNVGGLVWRSDKAVGGIETVASGQVYPFDIAVDGKAIYWTSETTPLVLAIAK
jgi:hypothetical protein